MSVLSWNCHGIGTSWASQFLKDLVSQKKPNIIFLRETLSKQDQLEKIKKYLGFEGLLVIDCQGQSGGLALIWRNKKEISLRSFSKNHIDVEVSVQGWRRFRLTGLYGEPNRAKRRETWDLIQFLARDNILPWCLIGDMNNVLSQVDKKGGGRYPSWLIRGFQDVMDDCELMDMDLIGYPYTFERGRSTAVWTEIRLDRSLVSKGWIETYQEAKLTNLKILISDHSPILLEPVTEKTVPSSKPFRFENAWLREPMCAKIVEDVWADHRDDKLQDKLSSCAKVLTNWGQDITDNFRERIAHCKKVLKATKGPRDETSVQQYQEASKRLNEVYTQKEVFWKQRSKQL